MTRIESPSSINTYKQCPRKYYYSYIEKIPGKENIYTVRGGIVHKALEHFFNINVDMLNEENYDIILRVVIMNLFNSGWRENIGKINELLNHNPRIIEHYYYESMKMINNWFDIFIARLKNEMINKDVQDGFIALKPRTEQKLVSESFSVQGYIDAVYDDSSGVKLIDYKTSRKGGISEEYKLQLAIYSLLYKENRDKAPGKVGIFFLGDGREQWIDVDDSLIKKAEDECNEMKEKTKSKDKKDYIRKPSGLCKYSHGQCDYYDICKPFD
ncbi:MAG TPA: PD-(D/E)XK nuclease family protein [Candidatus Nanoarchaeia archaeon]|nr:PD-(D/E)XK nuclease family protein [Candidatus Nanoarchaeia archaeon]